MRHAGKARQAGFKIIYWTLGLLVLLALGGVMATVVGSLVAAAASTLFFLWLLFAVFVLFFFRDPEPKTPAAAGTIVAPAHGTIDVIEEAAEAEVIGGTCWRISIFLSVFDVHVQNAPAAGKIVAFKHTAGRFVNAMRPDCGLENENLLIGIESAEMTGECLAVRLIAGLIARRIVPWISLGETVAKGERISLIQFGSRVDLFLPKRARIQASLGTRVKGGETIVAVLE